MEMKCANCGRELAPGARFCGICGQVVKEETKHVPSYPPKKPPMSLAVNRMPQGIALGIDERIVKQYRIGRYSFRKGSIEVIVTNKRVIRYEESNWLGMQNNSIDEINIDAVHGVITHMRRSISVIGLIASLILIIAGIFCLSSNGPGFGYGSYGPPVYMVVIGIAALGIAALILIKSLKPSLIFGLLGSVGNKALDTEVNLRGRIIRNDSSSVIFQFKPTPETVDMLKEIGACIYDLKTLGDKAIEKWS